jgi:hypothetical protein
MHPSGHSGLLGEVGYLLAAFHDGAFVVRADAVVATVPAEANASCDKNFTFRVQLNPDGREELKLTKGWS